MFDRSIVRYLVVAFGFTWVVAFGIIILHRYGHIDSNTRDLLHAIPAFGPAIGAFAVIPDRHYWARRLTWSNTTRWNWMIVTSPLLFMVSGLLIYGIVRHRNYDLNQFAVANFSSLARTAIFWLPLFTYGFFEEIGWRGFLLPRLQKRFTAWKSTILLTLIWGIWHFPFFFYRFSFSPFIAIGFFFGLWIGAIILTHLLNQNRGILWFGILFHFLNNLASSVEKEITVIVLSIGFMLLAWMIYRRFGPSNLSSTLRYMEG